MRDLYIEKTELELERLAAAESNTREELAQVRAHAEELFGDLERAEATIAALDGQLADIRATHAYRWSVSVASAHARLVPRRGAGGGRQAEAAFGQPGSAQKRRRNSSVSASDSARPIS